MILPVALAFCVVAVLWLTRPPDPVDALPIDPIETQENEEPPFEAKL